VFLTLALFAAAQPPADPRDADRPARWEKEVAAIEKRLKDAAVKPGGVVFAGSSSIRLWDLKKSFPGADYANAGFGGSEIRDSTHAAARLVTPWQPKAVVFYAGDNDIANNRTAEQVAADFRAFCAAVHEAAPKCRVLFVAVKPSILRWKRFDVQQKANAKVKEFCATDPRLAFVDIVPLMLGTDGKPVPELFAKDGLHLSAAGYEKWTAAVAAALAK